MKPAERSVLVVDDHEGMARSLEMILRRELTLRVRCVSGTQEALRAVREEIPAVVITDMRRPEGETAGHDLLLWLRRDPRTSRVPVIATSTGAVLGPARCDFDAVLEKPFSAHTLVERVRWLLAEPADRTAAADPAAPTPPVRPAPSAEPPMPGSDEPTESADTAGCGGASAEPALDPLTQGLLGAAAAQAVFGRRVRRAWLIGAVGGMIPDLDVLVRSDADPLLAIEYHRQFTHSLAFIPVGGAIASLPWLVRRRVRDGWAPILGAATVGYATHGLLDAFTTYGTQLLWPFSALRVAWSWIAIVDPAFTLALLVGVVLAARRGTRHPAGVALAFCALYLLLGGVQRGRALAAQERIAAARGHTPTRREAFPTFANQLVWRSLYQAGDSLHADRIRVPWLGSPEWTEGSTVALVRETDLRPAERASERAVRDFRRFTWFSGGWTARAPADSTVIGDARYSLRTDAFDPIWGVRFHPGAPVPTEWVNRTRDRSLGPGALWAEIVGTDPAYRRLPASRPGSAAPATPRVRPLSHPGT